MAGMRSDRMIRLSRSCLGDAEKQAVMGVLDRGFLGMGVEVQQFEHDLSEFFGRPAVCLVNGTAALHLALQACDIGRGDEVLVPSLTYVASFQAISATGAKAVACDVDARTLTLDWRDAESRVTPATRAVMAVHYAGGVGDIEGIYAFAQRNGLRVVEDASHAFGTTVQQIRIGSFGDISCFSFDGIKNITSGEGGCVVTDNEQVLQRVRDTRLLGVEKDTENRYLGQRSWEFDVAEQGWRYHMSNIMAAIGVEQLKRFNDLAERRRHLARRYDGLLATHERVIRLPLDYGAVIPHIYAIRIQGLKSQSTLRARMLEAGIQTGTHYQPNHWLTYYRDTTARPLPVTDAVFPELLTLPLHPGLEDEDTDYVCEKLLEFIDEH